MKTDLWRLFPRLLEEKINHLLDTAGPRPAKAFQLYKACQNEGLWRNSFEIFALHLQDYFSRARRERAKSQFDCFLDRPMDRHLYQNFDLSFRTAQIDREDIDEVARWSHEQLRSHCGGAPETSAVISEEVLGRTLGLITDPPPHEKDRDIDFDDFCAAWKKTVFYLFGRLYDPELEKILREVRRLSLELKTAEERTRRAERETFVPAIFLTQTEIDWTEAVQEAVFGCTEPPPFPLARGPQKPRLLELESAARLYRLLGSELTAEAAARLGRHRDSVRSTILDKCAWLLQNKAR